jgi:hypothetical protein
MYRPPCRGNGFFTILGIFILLFLIFYQVIITLIIPLRFNLFILFIEVLLLIFLIYRVIWPY